MMGRMKESKALYAMTIEIVNQALHKIVLELLLVYWKAQWTIQRCNGIK